MLPSWRAVAPPVRPSLNALLNEAGSFTQALRSCVGEVRVQPLREGWSTVRGEEALALDVMGVRQAFVREVLLISEPRRWVFARSVIPSSSLRGPNRELTQLGKQALGSVLFAGEGKRVTLEFSLLSGRHMLTRRLHSLGVEFQTGLPARRSVFQYRSLPLLVQEVLLPDLMEWSAHVPQLAKPLE